MTQARNPVTITGYRTWANSWGATWLLTWGIGGSQFLKLPPRWKRFV